MQDIYVEVIIPLSLSSTYTYSILGEDIDNIRVGQRVIVPFGKTKIYTGIIVNILSDIEKNNNYEVKSILYLLDNRAIVTPIQLKLWWWIASYYMSNIGDVLNAALPSVFKLSSETKIVLNGIDILDVSGLSLKEKMLVDTLNIKKELFIKDIEKILDQKTVLPLIKSMAEKKIINILEEVTNKYSEKKQVVISLSDKYDKDSLEEYLVSNAKKSPKQVMVIRRFLELLSEKGSVTQKDLVDSLSITASVISAIVDKGIFIKEEKFVSRFSDKEIKVLKSYSLSEAQQKAYNEITEAFNNNKPVMLYGITSAGKTQIYINLIEDCLKRGETALFLLPEIALTTQMIQRLQIYFGNSIGIYHSKYSDNERAEVWHKVLDGTYRVVLGARSSIFLPFKDLGLIIVDEEHETSYKQLDPSPRYNARDVALYLSTLHKSKIILGSATPSIESYYYAKTNKYALVKLTQRYGGVMLPEIQIADMVRESKRKSVKAYCSSLLFSEIDNALLKKEQVILFQNRRGYAPQLVCVNCDYVPKCKSCDVSLTYHKSDGLLHCHYCDYKQEVIKSCPVCNSVHIEQRGFGTERIEDELEIYFPHKNIARMDLNTTSTKNAFQKILSDLDDHKIDILVGTQMITKGLDFDNISLIGILNADSMLSYPDFRSYERSFQLMTQVAGRAGRRGNRGKVIIQTKDPEHPIINKVMYNKYDLFFEEEIKEREIYHYPPFVRLIKIDVKHKDLDKAKLLSKYLVECLRAVLNKRVNGPIEPSIAKVRDYYIENILIKVEKTASLKWIREQIFLAIEFFNKQEVSKGSVIRIDVDPQ